MVSLTALWLPILLAAIAVYIVSFLMWMVLPHHRTDWDRVPDEDGLMDALRKLELSPGQYAWPYCGGPKDMKDPAFLEKHAAGPSGFMTVIPKGPMQMGKAIGLSILNFAIICTFIAYITSRALPPGARYLDVFQIAGTAGVLGFIGCVAMQSIWYFQKWSTTFKTMFDGFVYAMIAAGFFGAFWPAA